ncbi:ubiquitin domain-containing protein DSK2b-like [Salvia splendens]|uniref:ubiquitin domain-containing protein DSK2b-like n=1 Tax=Salvia splendens TaxID=180675 RepID=UPI001C269A80|nr:ubiquitin domain-containing protein DSK2b-like [Salvia splendens]
MVQETIRLMLVEPHYLIQFFSITQRLRSVLDSNPQIRDLMDNPEFVHQLATPEIVNALLIYRSALEDQLYFDEETAEEILQRLLDLFVELAVRCGMIPAIARTDPP